MPETDNFKRLLYTWKATGVPPVLQSVDVFYLSLWMSRVQHAEADFIEELETNLLNASKPEEVKYLSYLTDKLSELPELLARLPTVSPTNLLKAFKAERPLKHTPFYYQVTAALAAPGKSTATPPYDNEDIACPFQIEHVQASFLKVYLLVNRELQKRTVPSVTEPMLPAGPSPLILKVDMVDLLDLLEIMQERGDWKIRENTSRKVLCQRIAALFELPVSKKGAQSPDWKRFYDLMAARETDKSRTLTNRSKKRLYDAIKPPEAG